MFAVGHYLGWMFKVCGSILLLNVGHNEIVLIISGNFDSTHGHTMGYIDYVGDNRNCLRSFATEFRGMLVGCADFRRFIV